MDKRQSILVEAMEIELNGIELYKSASEKTDDSQAREAFTFLSNEELKHYNTLKKIFDSISKGNGFKIELPIFEVPSFDKIFSYDFIANLKGKNFEFSAISTGMLLEKASINFYRKQKENSITEKEKELFETLEKWEEEHLRILERDYNDIKEKFWTDNKFYPF
jgi:rubrerythrin